MILTPKNWKSFQHYKERAPVWIKLHKGLLDNFEYTCLPVASKALAPMLWLLASEYEGGIIDASIEKIAFRLRMSAADLQEALTPLIDGGFFDASEMLAGRKQDATLEKRHIEKRNIEKAETDLSSASRTASNEDFDALKKIYPRRKGTYGWKGAEKKFLSLVKTGVDPKIILESARHLSVTLASRIGTEFIPMPASWLNSEDFLDVAVAAFDDACPPEIYENVL